MQTMPVCAYIKWIVYFKAVSLIWQTSGYVFYRKNDVYFSSSYFIIIMSYGMLNTGLYEPTSFMQIFLLS